MSIPARHYWAVSLVLALATFAILSLPQSRAELMIVGVAKAQGTTATGKERAELAAKMKAMRLLQLVGGADFEIVRTDEGRVRVRAMSSTQVSGWTFHDRQWVGDYSHVRGTPSAASRPAPRAAGKGSRTVKVRGAGDEAVELLDRAIMDGGLEFLGQGRTNRLTLHAQLVDSRFQMTNSPPAFEGKLVLSLVP